MSTHEVLLRITGRVPKRSLRRMFPDVFKEAEQRQAECPVQMGGPGNMELIYWLCEHTHAVKAVETGVAFGWSSLAFLLSLDTRAGALLISTDMPYPLRNNDKYVGYIIPKTYRRSWKLYPYADRQALPRAIKKHLKVDIAHYDSDKSYEGRMWAYPQMWDSLFPGGVLLSDDISDNVAFRDFSLAMGVLPHVVEFDDIGGVKKYIGVLVKPE